MEAVQEDLKSIRQRHRQIKELNSLMVEWAAGSISEKHPNSEKAIGLIKAFQLESELQRSQEYLDTLEDQEESIRQSYNLAVQEADSSRKIVGFLKNISGIRTSLASIERDEQFDVDISKYLVEFPTHDNQSDTECQAFAEMSDFRNIVNFEKKEYNIGLSKDTAELQKKIGSKYYLD
jgi:hypothetical protein